MKDAEAVFESAVAVRALDYAQEVAALHELMYRRGLDYVIRPNEELSTVRDFFTNLSRRAGLNQIWWVPFVPFVISKALFLRVDGLS